MEKTRIQKLFSWFFPFFVVVIAWINGRRVPVSYGYLLALTLLLGGAALVYIFLRERKNAYLPAGKHWPLALAMFVYLALRFAFSANIYASTPRFLYLMTIGLFFLIVWDGFERFVDHRAVLYGVLGISGLLLLISLSEIYQQYSNWWQVFGFLGEPPPYMYRVVSLLNTSNALMGLLNMLLPVALVLIVQDKTPLRRIFLAFWVLIYGVIFLFSSSRGGYLGAAAAVFVLLVLNFFRLDLWGKFRAMEKKTQAIILLGLALLLVLGAVAGYQFVLRSSAHPSHGGSTEGISLNRTGIWLGYLNIWKQHKLWGSGLGVFPLTFFEANTTSPPAFWPTYSHSFPIGILAEFGAVGAALIFGFLIVSAIAIFKRYLSLKKDDQLLVSGVLAGVASLAFHSVFDDFLNWRTVFFVCLVLVLWLLTYRQEPVTRSKRVRFYWLAPVIVGVMLLGWWNLRPYQVFDRAITGLKDGTLSAQEAAEKITDAAEIAPGSHFYQTEAGIYWYNAWLETRDPAALDAADRYLSTSLELEPALSIMWVNKALVSWNLGEARQAVEEMRQALELAPNEPVYHLNLGYYYEAMGEPEAASEQYRITLDETNAWGWYTHPYWQQTGLRQQVLSGWAVENELLAEEPLLDDFLLALSQPDAEPSAREIYLDLNWRSDIDQLPERLMMRGYLALADGQVEQAARHFESSFTYVYEPVRLLPLGWWEKVYGFSGWGKPFLPGVLQLSQDVGNLYPADVTHIFTLLAQDLSDEGLCRLAVAYQRAVLGGDLQAAEALLPQGCQ